MDRAVGWEWGEVGAGVGGIGGGGDRFKLSETIQTSVTVKL